MKKYLLVFFLIPIISFAQQDYGLFYNCWSGIPDTAGLTSNILIDSQNTPWIVGGGNNNLQIAHKNNSQWDYYTCPYGLGFSASVIDNSNHIWLQNSDSILEFDGTGFYYAFPSNNFIWPNYLEFDKYSNCLWYFDNNFQLASYNVITTQQNSYPLVSVPGVDGLMKIHGDRIYALGTNANFEVSVYRYDLPNPNPDSITTTPTFTSDDAVYLLVDSVGDCLIVNQTLSNGLFIYNIDSASLVCSLIYYNPNLYLVINEIMLGKNNSIWIRAENCFVLIENNQFFQFNPSLGIATPEWYAYSNAYAVDQSNHVWGLGFHFINSNSIEGVYEFSKYPFGNIEGKFYSDQNSNGNYDAGETLLPNQIAYHNQNSYANSEDTGVYYLKFIDSTLTYNVQPIIPNYWQCVSNCSYSVTPSVQLNSNYDFGLEPTGVFNDLNVAVTSTPARPGFTSAQNILVKNEGTTNQTPVLTYTFDAQENFVSAIPTPSSVSGNTLTWNMNSLTPFQQQNIQLWLSVPTSLALGTALTSVATVAGSGTENTPADNTYSLSQTVVGSFDPNEKTVSPSGNISSGDWLTYTICFQNTGTDTAFSVTVLDTLDSNLDFSTMSVTGYSHPLQWQIKGAGYLKFTFNNILLPDSNTNEALSHGYVSYRIKSKSGLPNGTQIDNTAHIYFDFNAAVVTNTTNTLIGPVGIVGLNEKSFSIYPSLVAKGNTVQISNAKIGAELQLLDCTGRILLREKIISSEFFLSIEKLSAGIYFVKCGGELRKICVE